MDTPAPASARPAPASDRPQMTLRVYRVTATGQRGTVRTSRFRPNTNELPDLSGCWPPCSCPRCKSKGRKP